MYTWPFFSGAIEMDDPYDLENCRQKVLCAATNLNLSKEGIRTLGSELKMLLG